MRRRNSIWIGILFLIFMAFCLGYGIKNAKASYATNYDTVALVRTFVYKDGQLPKADPRHEIIEDAAKAIEENCRRYDLDQALVAACIYAESSFDPKAVGFSNGEVGVMQVHGSARRRCQVAGLKLDKLGDQIQCGSYWLSYLETACGSVVNNTKRCLEKKDKDSCSGALSAYISGSCTSSKEIAKKVSYRLRLARWAIRRTDPLLLY